MPRNLVCLTPCPVISKLKRVCIDLLAALVLHNDIDGCFATLWVAQDEKDLEIIMLRHQVRILQRKISSSPWISKPEKLILTAIAHQMKQPTNWFHNRLQRCQLVFKPDTLLKWHRELVKRKWTIKR